MSTKPKDQTDIAAGLFFMALGGFFGWQALQMEIGTSIRMGPGYFPMVLSAILFLLGAVMLTVAHIGSGVLNPTTAPVSALMVVPAMLGTWLGFRAHDRLDAARFRRWTLVMLLLTGLNLLRRAIVAL